jgi:integrating conjugative element protein (TIGR03765 family)
MVKASRPWEVRMSEPRRLVQAGWTLVMWPLLTVLALATGRASALESVYDSGRSVPIAPYLAVAGNNPDNGWQAETRYPITSTLQRGVLPRAVPVFDASWLTHPLVVTGTDRHSMAWLLMHKQHLEDMNARVLVVEAHKGLQLAMAQSLVPLLPMWPRDDNWIEDRLRTAGASVYPLLIGTDGIARQILPLQRGVSPGGLR